MSNDVIQPYSEGFWGGEKRQVSQQKFVFSAPLPLHFLRALHLSLCNLYLYLFLQPYAYL